MYAQLVGFVIPDNSPRTDNNPYGPCLSVMSHPTGNDRKKKPSEYFRSGGIALPIK